MSYDSVDILRTFSDRVNLNFPLLADPGMDIINAFGIVNTTVDSESPYYGFPWAGYYLVDRDGVVTAKFFNEANNDRTTAANILVTEFGAKTGSREGRARTRHLTLRWSVTNKRLRPGQRSALVLNVKMKPGMHLYAPGEHEFIAVDWDMDGSEGAEFAEPIYPAAAEMYLPVIDGTVPVYDAEIRIMRDVHMLGGRDWPDPVKGLESLKITGAFRYQACDDEACYPPAVIPLSWDLNLEPHDQVRVPEGMQRGADSGGS